MSAFLALLALVVAGDPAADSRVERVLRLREELAALEASLSDAERQELAERLASPPAAAAPLAPAPGPAAPGLVVAVPVPPAPVAPGPESGPCPTLAFFDSDGDGRVSATDRYWRYLYVASGAVADGTAAGSGVESLYDAGVRSLDVGGRDWRGVGDRGGDLRGGPEITVALGRGAVRLLVDATALARRGGPQLLDDGGRPLDGPQPLARGRALRTAEGAIHPLACR